ncbi:MAG: DUF2254 domain-containing protein [Stenotrophomonas sp.]
MSTRWRWELLQFTRKLWVRVSLLALLGVTAALVAILIGRYIPESWPARIGSEAVGGILTILASSLLAVTTFSLSIVVAAYGSATTNVTPRATRLLMQDSHTQNMLATFIGGFLFSLVGLIALNAGVYGSRGRLVLFVATIAVVMLIVVTLLRWIEHITRLGRVGETTGRVEEITRQALRETRLNPNMGGRPTQPNAALLTNAWPVLAGQVGYVQHIDMQALSTFAKNNGLEILVAALPGSFVHPAKALAYVARDEHGDRQHPTACIRQAFTVGAQRSFDQDPRFGLSVLAEIASRALSPAINDPGTAIDVIGRAVRLLVDWRDDSPALAPEPVAYPEIQVPSLDVDDFFDDVFAPIARDGAALLEVQLRLQKALLALAQVDPDRFAAAALRHSRQALTRANATLQLEQEKQLLRAVFIEIERIASAHR